MGENIEKVINQNVKFLSPGSTEWLSISTKADDPEEQQKVKRNKDSLNELLLSSMQMQNLVVLSGSGTSLAKDNGGPSMHDLWEKCVKEQKEDENVYSEDVQEIFELLKYDYSDDSKVNIEDFLSLCEAYIQINQEDDNPVLDILNECKKTILEACSFKKNKDLISAHETFIHRLSRRRVRDSRLKIFTTNYDTCFEEAANNQGIVVIDGFSFARPRRYDPKFFDYDIVDRSTSREPSQNYLQGVFQLYKLHGSVNWEKDSAGEIWEREATPEGVCMIFPAKGKYQQSYIQPHLEIIARYLSVLRELNTCVVISGFGFNDDHLAEPIIAAINSNPFLKVIIADSNAEKKFSDDSDIVNKHWEKLKEYSHKGDDVWFINATFKEFSQLIPDLRSLTPAEKLATSIQQLAKDKYK